MISSAVRAAVFALALMLAGCHPATFRLHVLSINISIVVQPQAGTVRL